MQVKIDRQLLPLRPEHDGCAHGFTLLGARHSKSISHATITGRAVGLRGVSIATSIRSDTQEPATVIPPAGNPRFPLLDGLRAVAAGLVVVFHAATLATGHSHRLLQSLALEGIAIFFVLSGFLLYGPFVRARLHDRLPSIRAYARRRAIRIVPAYWIALTFALVVAGATSITLAHVPIYYLLLQDYLNGTRYQGLGVAWTLSIEATFYALLPLLAYVALKAGDWTRNRFRLLPEATIIAAFIAISAGVHVLRPGAPATILDYTDWFAGGMLLSLLAITLESKSLPALASVVLWIVGGALFFVVTQAGSADYVGHLLLLASATAIVTPAVFPAKGGPVTATLQIGVLRWLGVISYGIYLWHVPLMSAVEKVHNFTIGPLLVIGSALTVLIAAASYRFVESPLIQLSRHSRRDPTRR